jgi:hypothetical protein
MELAMSTLRELFLGILRNVLTIAACYGLGRYDLAAELAAREGIHEAEAWCDARPCS